ncbi:MAG TPA: nitrate ABC transporter substrate-binding protein, partial [Gammaproteobacteria bacterium]|nr:nitrate ABC transporter substrate-binding protein [Gammaproteobacteria bacterium]
MRTSGKKWLQDFSLKSLAKSLVIGAAATGMMSAPLQAEELELEKEDLKFGFIKLTDMAPLAIAY